jgi:hypothetical protein
MISFVEIVCNILNEENVAGSGGPLGVFDAHGPGVNFNYSPGDHRLPYSSPHLHRRNLSTGDNITRIGTGKKRNSRKGKRKNKRTKK